MRNLGIPSALMLLLTACAVSNFPSAPKPVEPASSPTSAPTMTRTQTSTATLPTPTFTSTATLQGLHPSITPPITLTPPASVTAIFTAVNTATPAYTVTPLSPGGGVESIAISLNKIYWGICKPNRTRITAKVEDPQDVHNVVFFVRLKDVTSDDTTPWSRGAGMDDRGNGLWTYDLKANTILGRGHYRRAWVFYQLVTTDIDGVVLGRTQIYTNSIVLEPCMCMTPPCD